MDKISTAKSHLYSNHAKKKDDTIKILGEGIREDVECIWPIENIK